MRDLRSNEVFKPGAFPEHTYVSRVSSEFSYTYEFRLEQALNTIGYLTSIIGPSKTGKTVLCEKVVGFSKLVELTGDDFKKTEPFWTTVAKKVGLSVEGDQTRMDVLEGERMQGVTESKSSALRETFHIGKDQVIEHFKRNGLVLVLDDFHYAPDEMQLEMAYQLKDAIRKGFRAIVISLPNRADDAIRKNRDLTGRLSLINIEPWQVEELKEIAVAGFRALDVQIADDLAADLAAESLTSPQLMQAICLNLAFLLQVDRDESIREIAERADLVEAYKLTTMNLPYQEVAKRLMAGPSTRGQKRKTYQLASGEEVDIYDLVLKAIALDPPAISLSLEELKQRIDQLFLEKDSKPDRNKIKSAVEQLQVIMSTSGSIFQVFEWKDNEIYILDPLFLFYLRWGNP